VTSTLTVEPLTAADRCDRCGAQAYVRVTLSAGSELLFCAHHGREYAPKLRELDAEILDESERLADQQPVTVASAGLSD
jgi:ribosomal protein L37E